MVGIKKIFKGKAVDAARDTGEQEKRGYDKKYGKKS